MISTLEKEITFRFLKARKKDGFLNVISIFSFIGISLGVAVLIIVMSVMNGFRTELINKIVGFNSHITVKTYGNPIDEKKINTILKDDINFEEFFKEASLNPNAHLIKGVICGFRVEEIKNPLTQQVRYLDKLVDELAQGKPLEKIFRQ